MTYDPQPEQPRQQPPPGYPASQPQPAGYSPPAYPMPPQRQGRRIIGMPLWLFFSLLGFLVCCGGFGIFAAFGSLLQGVEDGLAADPELNCTVTAVDDSNEILRTAEVEWTITNPGERDGNWTVHITVHDAQGRQVGEVYDGGFGIEPGATVVDQVTVFPDAAGGETCEIAVDQ